MTEDTYKLVEKLLNDPTYPSYMRDYEVKLETKSGAGGKVYHNSPVEVIFAEDTEIV